MFGITLDRLLIFAILLWTFIYTISYGVWTWKKRNRLGAIMVMLLALTELMLPIYHMFFHGF